MDDFAEIGEANHFGYEKTQETRRSKHDQIPSGECVYFDEAYERLMKLQELELAKIDVNMFKAINNQLINDGSAFSAVAKSCRSSICPASRMI